MDFQVLLSYFFTHMNFSFPTQINPLSRNSLEWIMFMFCNNCLNVIFSILQPGLIWVSPLCCSVQKAWQSICIHMNSYVLLFIWIHIIRMQRQQFPLTVVSVHQFYWDEQSQSHKYKSVEDVFHWKPFGKRRKTLL